MAPLSPDWALYRSFLTVLQEGSLSAAGRVLGVSQSTLSRHIATLEKAFGLSLFTRSPDGLVPTSAALTLQPHAETLAVAAEALLRAASGMPTETVGTVRVTASEIIAAEVIAPILASLQSDHPGIVVELVVSNRLDDLLRRDADIAVRMTRPHQGALIAKRIGEIELGLYAASSYLKHRQRPQSPADLTEHAIVGFDTPLPYTRTFQLDGQVLTREQFSFRTDSDIAQFAAIRAGCGIGVCHTPLAVREELTRILPDLFAPKIGMWLCMHEDQRMIAKCRLVFDRLAQGLCAYLDQANCQL